VHPGPLPAVVSLIPGSSRGSLILDFAPRTWFNWQTPHQLNASAAVAPAASRRPSALRTPSTDPWSSGRRDSCSPTGFVDAAPISPQYRCLTGGRAVKRRTTLAASYPLAAACNRKCDALRSFLCCVCARARPCSPGGTVGGPSVGGDDNPRHGRNCAMRAKAVRRVTVETNSCVAGPEGRFEVPGAARNLCRLPCMPQRKKYANRPGGERFAR
jgi:hypothetical protein